MPYNPILAKLRAVRTNAFNLEEMLDLARSGGADTQIILERITSAISYQFSLEEKTMKDLGIEIPEEHLDEHIKLLEEIKLQEKKWRENTISSEIFAESVKIKLFFHIRGHDYPLADSILHPSHN